MKNILICTYIMFLVISIVSSILSYKLIEKLPIENASTEKNTNRLYEYLFIPAITNLLLIILFIAINYGKTVWPDIFDLLPGLLMMIIYRIIYEIQIKHLKQRYGDISYNLYSYAVRLNELVIMALFMWATFGIRNSLNGHGTFM